MERTTPVQLPLKLHKTLKIDLIKNEDLKTFADLIAYYRAMTIRYIKKLDIESKSK